MIALPIRNPISRRGPLPARRAARRFVSCRIASLVVAALAIMVSVDAARADVEFDGLYSPGGVLQRGVKVPIFGTADDGDRITISFRGQSASTVAKDGKWRVELGPFEAGGPYTLSLSGTTTLDLKNLFVGDVWVCAGESNMQSPVQNAEGYSAALLSRKNRALHFFNVKRQGSASPKHGNASKWSEGGAATVGAFSAIGYYFGRDIQNALDIPIGLIACNHYSSSAEAWIARDSILDDPKLKHLVEDAPPRYDAISPGKLYNGMVLPIADYPIRGVICYQGDSNVDRPEEYRKLFPLLIADWRKAWNQPNLPFLFVQLTGYKATSKPNESKLATLREVQAEVAKEVPHTAMVVTTDLGDQYSQIPKTKDPVGKRLAFAARVLVYGEKFEFLGPAYREATLVKQDATLKFDHVGDGLLARDRKDQKVTGFTIAGSDEAYVPAEAEIVGDTVVVRNAEVTEPKFVRYNWADFPTGNLFNKDGYPAAPFRTKLPESSAAPAGGSPVAGTFEIIGGVLRLFGFGSEETPPAEVQPPETKLEKKPE